MKSIKAKLIIGILLILSIFLCGIFTYSLTFKNYFQKEKLGEMEYVILEVEDNISNIYDIDVIVNKIAEKSNVQIDVTDINSGGVICSTHKNSRSNMMGNGMGMGGQNKLQTLEVLGTVNGIEREIIHDKASGVNFLTATKNNVEAGYTITVKIPINIMDDAVTKSLKLLMIIFLPITLIILVITMIFANMFTRPIIDIRKKTSKIRDLDFDGKLDIKGKDEITDLANCVNSLSDKIENTLIELNSKNLILQDLIEKERENEVIRREFVSSVSHELKSPIAVISGYSQALKEGIITSKEDVEYYISVIDEEADRMQVIVNDLLDLYKLESNTFRLEIKEVEIGNLVQKIIRKNLLRFEELNINVESNIENILVMADDIRLEQAVQNYINNALSHVDLEKCIKIDVIKRDRKVRISVYNSGEAIDDRNIEKIWQGFVRLDKVRNYKEKRVGLGLAIVKQIMKLHHGNCGVNNKDNGVEFWIELDIIT